MISFLVFLQHLTMSATILSIIFCLLCVLECSFPISFPPSPLNCYLSVFLCPPLHDFSQGSDLGLLLCLGKHLLGIGSTCLTFYGHYLERNTCSFSRLLLLAFPALVTVIQTRNLESSLTLLLPFPLHIQPLGPISHSSEISGFCSSILITVALIEVFMDYGNSPLNFLPALSVSRL